MHPFFICQAPSKSIPPSQAFSQPATGFFVMAGRQAQFNTAAGFVIEGEVSHG